MADEVKFSVARPPWRVNGVSLRGDSGHASRVTDARTQGRKTISLPCAADVDDVFGGKPVARGVKTFSFDAPLRSSWLFRLRK